MSQFVYVNGQFVPYDQALVHVEDRGFQFSDGVYEVIAIHKGFTVDGIPHLQRLERSLNELEIPAPLSRSQFADVIRELLRRNEMENGTVYIQVTRGVAPRNHTFPEGPIEPTTVVTSKPFTFPEPEEKAFSACRVITAPDTRWARCDIKSVSLLANCLAKELARRAGAYEAVLFDRDGFVTECAAANAWIVTPDNELWTRHLDHAILAGICRKMTLALLQDEGITARQQPFMVDQMMQAREVFITTTTPMIKAVGRIDDTPIGDGNIGPLTRRLLEGYRARVFAIDGDT